MGKYNIVIEPTSSIHQPSNSIILDSYLFIHGLAHFYFGLIVENNYPY